ncbi:unnamed protein product [Paramecium sonneborni]|uniref:Uncharacterized protein n=1 Tax=Paramecium sonneborni TaxID=65129 RepID=A0A8S1NW01_9CILI|nr:unnamed protein product [Paramecium sonneborni]
MKQSTFKIVLVGDPRVGKSNTLTRFAFDKFEDGHKITIGVEFAQKNISINGKEIKLAIWDTCGAEQYRALTKIYYQGAAGALLIFDITDRSSFDNLEKWIKDIEQNTQSIIIMLIANKVDLQDQRKVSKQEAAQFAFEHKLAYLETSAKDGTGIQQAFEQLATEIVKLSNLAEITQKNNIKLTESTISKEVNVKQKNCC